MYRVVLDTNIWISALIKPSGKPALILTHGKVITPLVSQNILAEITKVIQYPRIQKRYGLTNEQIAEFLSNLQQISTLIDVHSQLHAVPADPKDNMIVECALDGSADYIVSGDLHLLNLREYMGVKIVTPSAFLSILEEAE